MAKSTYVKVDEQILLSPKIRKLILACGYEGLGFYIALLSTMRTFQATGYKIPLDDLSILSEWQLNIRSDAEQERFSNFIGTAVELDILKMSDKYIWSERRVNDLLKQEESCKKMSEAGRDGIIKRWEKSKSKTSL